MRTRPAVAMLSIHATSAHNNAAILKQEGNEAEAAFAKANAVDYDNAIRDLNFLAQALVSSEDGIHAKLRGLIMEAIGNASLCWVDDGGFDSVEVARLGGKLHAQIVTLMKVSGADMRKEDPQGQLDLTQCFG